MVRQRASYRGNAEEGQCIAYIAKGEIGARSNASALRERSRNGLAWRFRVWEFTKQRCARQCRIMEGLGTLSI